MNTGHSKFVKLSSKENLPLDSKIWIFQSSRYFTEEETAEIEETIHDFMHEWNAHGAALTSAYSILYRRFIVLAVDENEAVASGCSIDSMTRIIKSIEEKFKFGLLNRMLVSYKLNEEITTISLPEFKQKLRNNEIPEEATVFHNGITSMNEFNLHWELPLRESWAKAFLPAGMEK